LCLLVLPHSKFSLSTNLGIERGARETAKTALPIELTFAHTAMTRVRQLAGAGKSGVGKGERKMRPTRTAALFFARRTILRETFFPYQSGNTL
jgi:hypothetical protein